MERASGWDALDEYLDELMPYAREFDDSVNTKSLMPLGRLPDAHGWECRPR
jgi:hypothetical protein